MKVAEFSTYENPEAWICDDNTVIQFKSTGDACLAAELFRDLQADRDNFCAEKMQAVTELVTFTARLKETQITYRKTCLRLETERDDLLIETRNLRAELADAILQRDLARSDYQRDRVRMAELVTFQNRATAAEAELATARKELEQWHFALRHCAYYSMHEAYIIDMHIQGPAGADMVKDINSALAQKDKP